MKNKILLVDNDQQIQDMLMDLLKADYEFIPLQSSKEALPYLEENSDYIELIIMDLKEAMLSEFQILKDIQSHYLYENTPILLLADLGQSENISRAFAMGADDVLATPIDYDITKKRIYNLLDIGKLRRVHNVMEDLIEIEINENIEALGICTCPKCRKDLLTLTLNNVQPKYISTEKGETITKAARLASANDRIQLLAEITRYAKLIGENPRHG